VGLGASAHKKRRGKRKAGNVMDASALNPPGPFKLSMF